MLPQATRITRTWSATALCLVVLLLTARPAPGQSRHQWWHKAWQYRKLVRAPDKAGGPYRVWLYTGDRARPDGGDIRVIDPTGKSVPCTILYSTPESKHLLVFAKGNVPENKEGEEEGGDTARQPNVYSIYFGNPNAPPLPGWNPRAGLTLQTRAIPEDADLSSWQEAEKTLRRAKTVYGMGFWGHLFDAYNPFGPQSDYLSIYDGYFNCPKEGTYRFAVISEDPSFLSIDGQALVQWPPQAQDADTRRGQHGKPKELAAGVHHLRYVAFARGGPKRCAVYWVQPGAQLKPVTEGGPMGYQYAPMPGNVFGGVAGVQVAYCQSIRNPVCADFDVRAISYLESGSARMVAVQFTSKSTVMQGALRGYGWQFGDGQTADMANPIHVFLSPGTYEVKLALASTTGQKDVFTVNLEVEPIRHDLNFTRAKKDSFWKWTKDYGAEKLPTEHLLAFQQFLREEEKREKDTPQNPGT